MSRLTSAFLATTLIFGIYTAIFFLAVRPEAFFVETLGAVTVVLAVALAIGFLIGFIGGAIKKGAFYKTFFVTYFVALIIISALVTIGGLNGG